MVPALHPGDIVWLQPAELGDLWIGALVGFTMPGIEPPVVHRLVGWQDRGGRRAGICKGDHRCAADASPLAPENLVGVVCRVFRNGRVERLDTTLCRMKARLEACLSRSNLLPGIAAASAKRRIIGPLQHLSRMIGLRRWMLRRLRFYSYQTVRGEDILVARLGGKPVGRIVFDRRDRQVKKIGTDRFFALTLSSSALAEEAADRFPGLFQAVPARDLSIRHAICAREAVLRGR